MREDVLQNDTENMKQGHKENTASGRDVTIEMVDLTGDEWNAPEPDSENAGDGRTVGHRPAYPFYYHAG